MKHRAACLQQTESRTQRTHWRRKIGHLLTSTVTSLVCLSAVAAETPLTDARATLEKWVEARQQISKVKSDWQADKETIQQTILLFERELKNVAEQMSKVSTNTIQVDKERAEAEALQKASREGLERAREFVTNPDGHFSTAAGTATRLPRRRLPGRRLWLRSEVRCSDRQSLRRFLRGPSRQSRHCLRRTSLRRANSRRHVGSVDSFRGSLIAFKAAVLVGPRGSPRQTPCVYCLARTKRSAHR